MSFICTLRSEDPDPTVCYCLRRAYSSVLLLILGKINSSALVDLFIQKVIIIVLEDRYRIRQRFIIIIIIIIKIDRQCKARRGRLTPYQSEDPSPTLHLRGYLSFQVINASDYTHSTAQVIKMFAAWMYSSFQWSPAFMLGSKQKASFLHNALGSDSLLAVWSVRCSEVRTVRSK